DDEPMDHAFRAATARIWVGRGSQCRHRVSLGGGSHRALRRDGGRVRPAQGQCHCHALDPAGRGGKAGDIGHPDRVHECRRSGCQRPRRKPGAAGRQHHRPVDPRNRHRREATRPLREVVPGLRRLAIMGNVGNPAGVLEMEEIQATARALGLEVIALEIRRPEDITPAFEVVKSGAVALYISHDALINTNRIRVNTLALGARLPTMSSVREYVAAGSLMSYGANLPDLWRRAAEFVDKILRGAKPADIPVEQPTKFDLVLNITTAKALGLTIPESFLLRADEVIE